MAFRLSDMDVRWHGIDATTPPGFYLASGVDPLGNTRIWLFKGDHMSDEAFAGSIIVPPVGRSSTFTAYARNGGYFGSGRDTAELLDRLAKVTPK